MDIRQSPHSDNSELTEAPASQEPVIARVVQAMILVVGLLLLFSVMLGKKVGPGIVGAVLVVTAIPPLRRIVDVWLVGEPKGKRANQATVLRVGAGTAIIMLAAFGLIPL